MKKIISFVNRTKEQIYSAFGLLKRKWRKVEFVCRIINGLFVGHFILEGERANWYRFA